MSTYLNLPDGPEPVARVGDRLKAEAEEFQRKAADLLLQIQDLDGGQPWGHDEAGTAFEQQYHKPMGEEGTLAHALQERLRTAGGLLNELGGKVTTAMATYDATDQTGGGAIAGAV